MKLTDYEKRVRQLEREGCTRSDAQGVADAELMRDPSKARAGSVLPPLTLKEAREIELERRQGHTPGPWTYYNSQGSRIFNNWRITSPTIPICTLANSDAKDQHEANARLIAAAPELLEALEAALKEMQGFRAYWASPKMNLARSKASAEEVAEAAIAKAKGRK